MGVWRRVERRLSWLPWYRRGAREAELARELRDHLDLEADEQRAAGLSAQQAGYAAHRALGNALKIEEDVRAAWGLQRLETFAQDIRYALRMLRKSPGFTAVAVLTLALGIGANTAIFSLLNAVLIRSLPYEDPGQLAYLWTPNHNFPNVPIDAIGPSNGDFFDIQRQARSFSAMALFNPQSFNLATQGTAQRIGGASVRANFFSTLGVRPLLGREIEEADTEPGHQPVADISYALWQAAFGGSTKVLGQEVKVDGESYRIIGVMPASFRYPSANEVPDSSLDRAQIWLPMVLSPAQKADRDNSTGDAIVRLRPGVTVAQAQAELNTIMPRLDLLHNAQIFGHGWYGVVRPFKETVLGGVRLFMWLLFGAVCLVLLIACANAANLLLARAASRTHEMGMRAALGARRGRLIRQVLTEALMLACAGGALGVLIAYGAIRLLLLLNPGNIPRLGQTSLDLPVLFFTVGISILTGVIFGIVPALGASRTNLAELLKQSGSRGIVGGSKRWRHGLIVGEVALAVVLLTGSGLLIRSYINLESVATGFSDSTLTMSIALDQRYNKPEQRQEFYRRVIGKLGALPGVNVIGATDDLPLSGSEEMGEFTVEGYANVQHQLVDQRDVTSRYFEAMGTPLLAGRYFTPEDTASKAAGVVIVNEAFAQAYFRGRSAVGRHFCMCYVTKGSPVWSTIVGVVPNVRHDNLENAPPPQVYLPFFRTGLAPDRAYIAIRSSAPPAQMIPAIRNTVREIDPNLAVASIATMDQRISQASALRRFQMSLFSVFGGIALFLAAIGLYALMAYSVKLRTNEIGIRLALGAQTSDIWRLVIAQAATLTLAGVILGVAGALALTRLLASLLYGVAPLDPVTFLMAIAVLGGVSLLACYVPARRAMRVDPMVALRYE